VTASSPRRVGVIAALTLSSIVRIVSAQETLPPSLKAGVLADSHAIDGRLIEPAWANAPTIDAFIQNEPTEGAPPSARTTVRVLAGSTALVNPHPAAHAQLQAGFDDVALQYRTPHSAAARNESMGVGRAAIRVDADEPRRNTDRPS
jgi:hypothetical protein